MAKKEERQEEQQLDREAEKERLKEERKKLKEQKKEAKKKAKEISAQEDELLEEEDPGGMPVFLVTVIIIAVWIAILCVLIKLDVGGIGSNVLRPILKNVPVVNKILPTEPIPGAEEEDETGGYRSIEEAVRQIRVLEQELEIAQAENLSHDEEMAELREEINRLQNFEDNQLEFEQTKNEFYEEVVYAENGPGAEEYKKYYEAMDPATAEYLYQKVVQEVEESKEIQEYASAYSSMKAKEAAAIFDTMTDDLDLVARILGAMGADDRGKILGQMDEENAARVTKIMDPEN